MQTVKQKKRNEQRKNQFSNVSVLEQFYSWLLGSEPKTVVGSIESKGSLAGGEAAISHLQSAI